MALSVHSARSLRCLKCSKPKRADVPYEEGNIGEHSGVLVARE